jgi:hypothetical protein
MGTGDLPLDPRCSRMPVSREQEGCQRRSTRAIDDQPAVRAPPEGDSRRGHRCTREGIAAQGWTSSSRLAGVTGIKGE